MYGTETDTERTQNTSEHCASSPKHKSRQFDTQTRKTQKTQKTQKAQKTQRETFATPVGSEPEDDDMFWREMEEQFQNFIHELKGGTRKGSNHGCQKWPNFRPLMGHHKLVLHVHALQVQVDRAEKDIFILEWYITIEGLFSSKS